MKRIIEYNTTNHVDRDVHHHEDPGEASQPHQEIYWQLKCLAEIFHDIVLNPGYRHPKGNARTGTGRMTIAPLPARVFLKLVYVNFVVYFALKNSGEFCRITSDLLG